MIQRYKNKVLRATVNAPRYVSNKVLLTDLEIPTIREETTKFSVKHRDKITFLHNKLPHIKIGDLSPILFLVSGSTVPQIKKNIPSAPRAPDVENSCCGP
jgi:hypothetical protein